MQDSCLDVEPRKRSRPEPPSGGKGQQLSEESSLLKSQTVTQDPSFNQTQSESVKQNSMNGSCESGMVVDSRQNSSREDPARRQMKLIVNSSIPITRLYYEPSELKIRSLLMNKAASILYGTVCMSQEDLNDGRDVRWIHPDDQPERYSSYGAHLKSPSMCENEICVYSNNFESTPVKLPRTILTKTGEAVPEGVRKIVTGETCRYMENFVERNVRPLLSADDFVRLECVFQGKFLRMFRTVSEEQAIARARNPSVTVDGEPSEENPYCVSYPRVSSISLIQ